MRRLAQLLLASGVVLLLLGAAAWVSGIWISLSPAAARILVLTFTVIVSEILLAAGAFVGRLSRSARPNEQPIDRVGPLDRS